MSNNFCLIPPLQITETSTMDRDRGARREDRRRRDDTRDRRPNNGTQNLNSRQAAQTDERLDRDRSRSPPTRERRDDRRRDRSPPRSPRRAPPSHSNRDRERSPNSRNTNTRDTPPPPRRPNDRNRQPLDPRSANPTPRSGRPGPKPVKAAPDTRMGNGLEDEDEEAEMKRIMGFGGFRSTKNTKVPGNDKNYGVAKAKTTEYRQYMNRTGGFNRALSPSRQ